MYESTRIAYLYAVRNVYILAKRELKVVLEDRKGSAENNLRKLILLKWSK